MTERITLSCHCGGTRLAVNRAPTHATQCTCSYCTKSGALWGYCEIVGATVLSETHGAVYSPTTPLHEHHFCVRCGCTTYGISPDYSLEDTTIPDKKKLAYNVKLLDDYALFTALTIDTIDGRNLW